MVVHARMDLCDNFVHEVRCVLWVWSPGLPNALGGYDETPEIMSSHLKVRTAGGVLYKVPATDWSVGIAGCVLYESWSEGIAGCVLYESWSEGIAGCVL